MKAPVVALGFLAGFAVAQTPVTQYPEGAAVLSPDSLTAAVGDKVFRARPATGPVWRLQFNANGYFFVNAGDFADNGRWSVKDSTLCTEGRKIQASCSDVQGKDGVLYLKRQSGEILRLEPW